MNMKNLLTLTLSLSLMACSVQTPTNQLGSQLPGHPSLNSSIQSKGLITSNLKTTAHSEKVTFKLNLNNLIKEKKATIPPRGKAFKTQAINIADLKWIKLSLVGSGITGTMTNDGNAFVPVANNTATAAISNVPLSAGAIRVVTVQGYDTNNNPLPAFTGKGYYRSSAGVVSININISRRNYVTGRVLEQLISEGNPLANTLDFASLRNQLDTATGFNSTTNQFTTDPLRVNISNLTTLVKNGGGTVTSAQVTANAQSVAVNVNAAWKTPNGGPTDENFKIIINDPKSTELTVNSGTASPGSSTLNGVVPGTWKATFKKNDGTVLATTNITVDHNGAFTQATNPVILTGIPEKTGLQTAAAGQNSANYFGGDGSTTINNAVVATATGFNSVQGMHIDKNGNFFYVGQGEHRVRMVPKVDGTYFGIAMTGGNVYTILGDGVAGETGNNGPAAAARASHPYGIATDSLGNVYFTDSFPTGSVRMICKVAGTYFGTAMTANNVYQVSNIGRPHGLHIDANNNIYIARNDAAINTIVMIPAATGTNFGIAMTKDVPSVIAGTGVVGALTFGGVATASNINRPIVIDTDAQGNVYFGQANAAGSDHVAMVPAVTGTYFGQAMTVGNLYRIAGLGPSGANTMFGNNGGDPKTFNISMVWGLVVDANRNILFSTEQGNNRIWMISDTPGTYYGTTSTVSGNMYAIAGNGSTTANGLGNAPLATNGIGDSALALDLVGNLIVSGHSNSNTRIWSIGK